MANRGSQPGPAAAPVQPGAAGAAAIDQPTPVTPTDRIETLDVLRGAAVLGILLMNIVSFGIAWQGVANTLDNFGPSPIDRATWIASDVLIEGTMRGLFSLLFGAGVILLTTRIEQRSSSRRAMVIHYRRSVWLVAFGLFHAYTLLWRSDILYVYGVAALALYPIRKLAPRTLIVIGIIVLAAQTISAAIEHRDDIAMRVGHAKAERLEAAGQPIPPHIEQAHEDWLKRNVDDPDARAEEVDTMRSGYFTVFTTVARHNREIQTVELIKYNLWDALGVMLIGMALMKLDWLSGSWSNRAYSCVMVIGYIVGISVNSAEITAFIRSQMNDHSPMPWFTYYTYDVARVPLTLAHASLIVLLVKSGVLRRLFSALAAAGRMALTNYIGQSVICGLLFYGFGFGLYDRLSHSQLMLVTVGIWILQVSFSVLWMRHFRYGPLEWLWRCLTYMNLQPIVLPQGMPKPE